MVAPLDPIRGPASVPQTATPRTNTGSSDLFELELQRMLKGDAPEAPRASATPVVLNDDLAASLEGVSESLQRATAYINSARAYFKGAPGAPPAPDAGLDRRG